MVFTYPQTHLNLEEVLDYDAYWKEKRGSVHDVRARQISGNERMRADYVVRVIGDTPVTIGDIASMVLS